MENYNYDVVDIFFIHQLGQEQPSGRWELLKSVSIGARLMKNNQKEPKAVLIVRCMGPKWEDQKCRKI